jgi:nucleotide-binding universal stress UspA family protein
VNKFGEEIEIDMIIGRGETRDEIVDFVETSKAGILIMGNRGLGALKRYIYFVNFFINRTFLGSTSDYCIHHCHCPVLIVKN